MEKLQEALNCLNSFIETLNEKNIKTDRLFVSMLIFDSVQYFNGNYYISGVEYSNNSFKYMGYEVFPSTYLKEFEVNAVMK